MSLSPEQIAEILREATGGLHEIDPETELLDSGILDSFALIQLFNALEDRGVALQPTQVRREEMKTPAAIAEAISQRANKDI